MQAWLEEQLKQHDCDAPSLLDAVELAQQAGLPQPLVLALRKQITAAQLPAAAVTPTAQPESATGAPAPTHTQIGPGSVLKNRFELVSVLGEGGMGKVFRARDLLKVEAGDPNPFVAVKILSGDSRQHPEVSMALEREANQAQGLAHPAIATVFDFDCDGGTSFLTMELMDGEELSVYIERLPAGGLPVAQAMQIIRQLCDALSYVHARGLVHCDFKPGNVFITSHGRVKLLDFSIARAMQTSHDGSGTPTTIDSGGMGALTPAYAALEMFEGGDPDPRDDIYALACVACLLLTGKHPFNRLPAPQVLEQGLRPARIAKLTRRQNHALRNALAITREDRTPSVAQFWEDLRPRKNCSVQFGQYVLLLVIVLAILGYRPIEAYLRARRNHALVSQIQSGNTSIPAVLARISRFDPESRRFILVNGKAGIIRYFEAQAEAFADQTQGQYNYPAALDAIARAAQFYSDSPELARERTSLESRRKELRVELAGEFNARLAAGRILPATGNSITDVIRILRSADPQNALLHDQRLIDQYAQLARKDLQAGNYAGANLAVTAGLDYAPHDAGLLELQRQIQRSARP